jgi:GTP-binding protein
VKIESAEFVISAHGVEDFPADGRPEVAFAGRSNVGKSSLMNRLLGRPSLARTSSTPGRTRAVNYFLINRRCYFVDLPGYGYAKAGRDERRRWAELVDRYLKRPAGRRQVVLLVDSKVGATDSDVQAFGFLAGFGVRLIVAATKIDRLGRARRAAALAEIRRRLAAADDRYPLVAVSSRTGEGTNTLWNEIEQRL